MSLPILYKTLRTFLLFKTSSSSSYDSTSFLKIFYNLTNGSFNNSKPILITIKEFFDNIGFIQYLICVDQAKRTGPGFQSFDSNMKWFDSMVAYNHYLDNDKIIIEISKKIPNFDKTEYILTNTQTGCNSKQEYSNVLNALNNLKEDEIKKLQNMKDSISIDDFFSNKTSPVQPQSTQQTVEVQLTQSNNTEAEVPVTNNKSVTIADAAKKAADVDAAKKAADVDAAKKAADVDAAKKATDVDAAKKATDVDAAKKATDEVKKKADEAKKKAESEAKKKAAESEAAKKKAEAEAEKCNSLNESYDFLTGIGLTSLESAKETSFNENFFYGNKYKTKITETMEFEDFQKKKGKHIENLESDISICNEDLKLKIEKWKKSNDPGNPFFSTTNGGKKSRKHKAKPVSKKYRGKKTKRTYHKQHK